MRPGIKPTWMPSFSRVTASGNLSPVLMHPEAFFTTSEVMKLSVPSWSSSPHRPQFLTRLEI